jgi:hypothetical protein
MDFVRSVIAVIVSDEPKSNDHKNRNGGSAGTTPTHAAANRHHQEPAAPSGLFGVCATKRSDASLRIEHMDDGEPGLCRMCRGEEVRPLLRFSPKDTSGSVPEPCSIFVFFVFNR